MTITEPAVVELNDGDTVRASDDTVERMVCNRLLDAETNEHCEWDGRAVVTAAGEWRCGNGHRHHSVRPARRRVSGVGHSAISDSLRDLISGLDTLSPAELRRARSVLVAGVAHAETLLDIQRQSWMPEQ